MSQLRKSQDKLRGLEKQHGNFILLLLFGEIDFREDRHEDFKLEIKISPDAIRAIKSISENIEMAVNSFRKIKILK